MSVNQIILEETIGASSNGQNGQNGGGIQMKKVKIKKMSKTVVVLFMHQTLSQF